MKKSILFFLLLLIKLNISAQTLQDEWITCNKAGCKILDPYYFDGATMVWEGNCKDGKADGNGKLIKYNKGIYESTYEGEYANGIREGKGKFTHNDGTVKEGTFVNGQLTGKGTMTSENGLKYEGEFINYRFHGEGIESFPNGSKFEGFFVSDRMYTGKYTNYDGKITYLQKGMPVEKIKEEKNNYAPKFNELVTEYFNSSWKRCEAKEAAFYRRVTYISANKPKGVIKDYFISGQLQSEFSCIYLDYEDEGKNFHEGQAIYYYQSGKIKQNWTYFNNKFNGIQTSWYENGLKQAESNYNFGSLNGFFYEWYPSGNLKIKAYYEHGSLADNKYLECDENGACAIVYKEIFSKNIKNWENKDEASATESTINKANNSVSIKCKKKVSISKWAYIPFNQNGNFSIECTIDRKDMEANNAAGISFGFKDWDNYFQFVATGLGSFNIYGRMEGVNLKIKEWTPSNYINLDKGSHRNTFKIIKISDSYLFSINGQLVAKENAKTYPLRGNYFGISMAGEGEIILESLIFRELLEKPTGATGTTEVVESKTTEDDWLGNGSGFFINEKGYIATNYHVVKDAKVIQVEYFQNGIKKTYKAKVITTDKQNDLAIIKIDDATFVDLPKIPYTFSTNIKDVGTSVFTLGYPLALDIMGEEIKFTDGKISAKTGYQGDITVYQISTPVQPGNSGGPLFDNDGNLIGIVSSGLPSADNVNYAIKSTYLKNLIDVLPTKITPPSDATIVNKSLTEKIKLLSGYIPIIKIK